MFGLLPTRLEVQLVEEAAEDPDVPEAGEILEIEKGEEEHY